MNHQDMPAKIKPVSPAGVKRLVNLWPEPETVLNGAIA
jgi:hypothetical protein